MGRKIAEGPRARAAGPADAVAGVLGDLGVLGRRVGLDEGNLFAPTWKRVEERLAPTALVPAYQMFRQARMVKGPGEVAALERAALVAEDGIAAVLAMLKPGVTEREAARAYEQEVLRRGAQPFFTVVTIGERAAPAGVYPSDRARRPGGLVRFALGCLSGAALSRLSPTGGPCAPTPEN